MLSYVKIQLLPVKFGYSHHQFAGYCMDVIGRSYLLITLGSIMFDFSLDDLDPYSVYTLKVSNRWCWFNIYLKALN